MSELNLFYKLIYYLIAGIYLIYCKLLRLKSRFGSQLTLTDLINIRESKIFKKKNEHIAIVVNYDDNQPLSDDNLVKLISWSIVFKIPFISVYDHDGILIKKRKSICDKMMFYLEDNANVIGKFKIIKGEHERSFNIKGDDYNGKIRFIDVLDGKEKVLSSVKQLLHEKSAVDNNNITNNNGLIDSIYPSTHPNLLTNKLHEEFKFPDPDFGIICSSIYNIYGYPAWEIRYTEFVLIPDLNNVTIKDYKECLVVFNKKEQRKGK